MYAIMYPGMTLGHGFIRALFSDEGRFPATLRGPRRKKGVAAIRTVLRASELAPGCCYVGDSCPVPAGTGVVWIETESSNARAPFVAPPSGALVLSLEGLLSSPEESISRMFEFLSLSPDWDYMGKVISDRAKGLLKALSELCSSEPGDRG
jgi:hypothetical protein